MRNNNKRRIAGRSLSNNALAGTIIFSNADMSVDEKGWTLIPYGKWLHSLGWQHFAKEDAVAMCNTFTRAAEGVVNKIRRFVIGLPVFKGHPDEPELASQFPDDTIYGQTAEMEARENGLAIKMVLSNAGASLVEKGLKYISPRWHAEQHGVKDDGSKIWIPKQMLSIGLVDRPNIPNAKLCNYSPDFMNKAELIALFKLAADATDEQVRAALSNAASRPEASALSNAESRLTTAATELGTVRVSLANVTTERDNATAALANERKAHRTSLVNAAIRDGRVIPADQALWVGRLEANFDAEAKTLANMAPTIKVGATTEQCLLAHLNAKLAGMSDAQRLEFSKVGILSNDDGAGDGDDMANVKDLHNLTMAEMQDPKSSCANLKDPNKKYAAAQSNVLKRHPKFLTPAKA